MILTTGHFPVELPTQAQEAGTSSPPAADATTIQAEENRLPSVATLPQPLLASSVVYPTNAPSKPEPSGGCIVDLAQVDQLVRQQQQHSASHSPMQELPKTFDSRLTWSYYTSPEDLEALIASLNARGQREIKLKKALEALIIASVVLHFLFTLVN